MQIARVRPPDADASYAILKEDEARLLDGAPWLGGRPTGRVYARDEVVFAAPVKPSKVVGVGRNYRDHVIEMGYELPTQPTVFLKPPTTIVAPGGVVVLPPQDVSDEVEHEAELVVVMGREASDVPEGCTEEFIYGYTIANDVSARDLQRSDATLARGKGWDTFCPIGPWIETELDPASLAVRCRVNGVMKQDGNTSDLIFGVDALVSYVSKFMRLLPGDVILTGSPGGSDRMNPGDRVEIEVEGIGTLIHGVEAAPGDRDV